MSGLTGVLWHDARPAKPEDLTGLLAELSHRRGDHVAVTRGAVAMACLDEASLSTPTPFLSSSVITTDVIVMLDGRIDNRDDLISSLDLARDSSDVTIIAAAWRRWGRDCPIHLIGDFAFTIFDGEKLFAARDVVGYQPFYYRPTNRAWYWSSEIAGLVRVDRPAINEGVIADYLADNVATFDETLFNGVFRLPPAHAIEIARDGQQKIWRYWHPDPRAEIRYRDQREYDEHFRTLFRQAVRDTLRASGTVALWYSGGVDSTAVISEMAALRDAGDPSIALQLETVSMTVPGFAQDERPYFEAGARHFGFRNTVVPLYFGSADDFERDAVASLQLPRAPNSMSARCVWHALADRGVHVSLTGLGGDDWFMGSQFALVDDLRRFRVGRVLQRLAADRALQIGFSPWTLLRLAAWLQLSEDSRTLIRRAMRWRVTPTHISPSLAQRVHLEDRLRAQSDVGGWQTHAQRDLFVSAAGAPAVDRRESHARAAAAAGVETRHPFHDRRLIEFALALPAEQLWRSGTPRSIVLSALGNRMPRDVFSRVDGVDFTPVMVDALERLGGRDRLQTVLRDLPQWVEPATLSHIGERVWNADEATRGTLGREVWIVWNAFAVHWFWQAAQSASSRVVPLAGPVLVQGVQ